MTRQGKVVRDVVHTLTTYCLLIGTIGAASAQVTDYKLNPGDELAVSVWQEEALTTTVKVRPDGKFSVPLAGEIDAAGRSVAQVQNDIVTRLKKYIPDAVATVALVGMEGNKIYVIGQVGKPGAFVMNPTFTVLQALSLAGGLTPFAGANDIIVLRGSGAQQRLLPFRFADVSKGRSLEQNITLMAGDVIIVP